MSSGLIGVRRALKRAPDQWRFCSLVCSLRDPVVGSFRMYQLVDRDQF